MGFQLGKIVTFNSTQDLLQESKYNCQLLGNIETCTEQRRPKLQDVIHVFTIALIFLMYLLAFLFLNLLFYIYCNETALVKKAIMYVCVYYVCDWFKVIHHNHMEN